MLAGAGHVAKGAAGSEQLLTGWSGAGAACEHPQSADAEAGHGQQQAGPCQKRQRCEESQCAPLPNSHTQHPLCCNVQEAQQCGQVCGMYAVWLSVEQEASEEEQGYLL